METNIITNKKIDYLLVIIITLVILEICLITIIVHDYFNQEIREEINITEESIINECKNLSLNSTANCLAKNIRKIYKYVKTDDDLAKNMTFEETKELGNDCGGYAYLYERLAEKLEFEAKTVHVPRHRFAVISRNGSFCILNMMDVKCFGDLNLN